MKEYYLKKADENLPEPIYEKIRVRSETRELSRGDSIVLDLGDYYVGRFSFVLGYKDMYLDAPVRLCIKFCETKEEIDADFSTYNGSLCPSWLQEEIINIDMIGEYKMPRRYAARYIKISVVYTPKILTLSDFVFTSETSADVAAVEKMEIDDPELCAIDKVAQNTLKNCMHRVFEDGPKRDRRLWASDFRLQALTNHYTFKNSALVRRCLYLFAAADKSEDGFLPAYLYENPNFFSGTWYLRDFALNYVNALSDYCMHTGDSETFLDIYPVVKEMMEAFAAEIDENGILVTEKQGNVFIDWQGELKKTASLQGVYLYTLENLSSALARLEHGDAELYRSRYESAKAAALRHLYNANEDNFANAYDEYQVNIHSVVWMILGGVVSGEGAWEMLLRVMNDEKCPKIVTPYMNHYLVEAMMKLGKEKEAMEHIKSFWGLMVKQGADAFYEVFVPGHPEVSPYLDPMINSMCHAWSCTPSYFIRKRAQGL